MLSLITNETGEIVEEFLRHKSPIQILLRFAREDLDLHGQSISAGQRIIPMIGAANRDPAQFPDPDRLDLRRPPIPTSDWDMAFTSA
ncbi:MAG: cytochrome P450 [Chloroflexaceae bacterium]